MTRFVMRSDFSTWRDYTYRHLVFQSTAAGLYNDTFNGTVVAVRDRAPGLLIASPSWAAVTSLARSGLP